MSLLTRCAGWAYDLKTVSEEMIVKRAARTGDGTNHFSDCIPDGGAATTVIPLKKSDLNEPEPQSTHQHHDHDHHHHHHEHTHENMIWGWDDEDMAEVDRKDALIINKKDDE